MTGHSPWVAKHPTTVVTLLKPVPAGLLDAVGLVSAGNAGDVLTLDSEAAVALVRSGIARYGSVATDPPAVAAPTQATTPTTDTAREAYIPARLSAASLKAAYVAPLPTAGSFTYNADGTIASDPDGNSYTWNADGTPATQTKGGVTRTFHWNTDGTLASVS